MWSSESSKLRLDGRVHTMALAVAMQVLKREEVQESLEALMLR